MNAINDQLTANEVKDTLNGLRKDTGSYSSAYEATMERINQQQRRRSDLGKRILAWVVHAKRPLSFEELNHALATRLGKRSISSGDTYAKEVILSVCAGLVTLDVDKLRLIHYTAQEFFSDTWLRWFPTESAAIVDTCLTYLSFKELRTGPYHDSEPYDDNLTDGKIFKILEGRISGGGPMRSRDDDYPLFRYAADNWGHHLRDQDRLAKSNKTTAKTVLCFLEDTSLVRNTAQAMDILDVGISVHGVHLAAFFGLQDLTMLLVARGHDAHIGNDCGRTPLWWAAREGHVDLVRALLEYEHVGVDERNSTLLVQTTLSTAAEKEQEAVPRMSPSNAQITIDAGDVNGHTALFAATMSGHGSIVQILLDTGLVDINRKDRGNWTPLCYAVRYGHEAVVKMLLSDEKIVIERADNSAKCALVLAAQEGHEHIVQMLLDAGFVKIDEKVSGRTPLAIAAERGHEGVVRALLMTERVDVNSKDSWGLTPLSVAVFATNEGPLKALLSAKGVDIDPNDNYNRTPLSIAAEFGRERMVEALLATKRVDFNLKDLSGRSPLSYAAENGHEEIVKKISENEGAKVNSEDRYCRTPLSYAAGNGHEGVVKILLSIRGLAVNSEDRFAQTALKWAIRKGHDGAVALLISAGASAPPMEYHSTWNRNLGRRRW